MKLYCQKIMSYKPNTQPSPHGPMKKEGKKRIKEKERGEKKGRGQTKEREKRKKERGRETEGSAPDSSFVLALRPFM
jgi:hypothetical protein